jgi:hypothetical protein
MKVDLNAVRSDMDNFMVHEHVVAGEKVYLVQPVHIGARWSQSNLHQRSSVWNAQGELISASFKKFFNWDEKPEIDTPPSNLGEAQLMEKLDGSTLIVSRYKGHTIIRTRGTVDATLLDNGHEVEGLMLKYPKFKAFIEKFETSPHSYIFEWTSPNNKIVLDYGAEPDITLIAMIGHADYFLQPQSFLDLVALDFDLKRPKKFEYASIDEMKAAVEAFKGVEGLCVYYNNGQSIRKVKSAEYLFLHRAKSDISSLEKVIDLYFNYADVLGHSPSYVEFFEYLEKAYDHEIAVMARGHASNIADGMKEVDQIVAGMKVFAEKVRPLPRKKAAESIFQAYGQTARTSFIFKLLDLRPLDSKEQMKLLYQVLKK